MANGARCMKSRCIFAYIALRLVLSSSFAAASVASVSSLSKKWQRQARIFSLLASESSGFAQNAWVLELASR